MDITSIASALRPSDRLVIHSTTDTRQRDPLTGKRLAGTGDSIPCDCCGKLIQVHVSVAACEPVHREGRLIGYRPVSSSYTIGQSCAKRMKAVDRFADRCAFKWITE